MKKTESIKKLKTRHNSRKVRSGIKKQQRQAERTAAKQQLKKDPLDLSRQEKREYFGWD